MLHRNLAYAVRNSTSYFKGNRHYSVSTIYFSGHNRWSKIKHDKAKVDGSKTQQRSALSKEIALASRLYGPDPHINTRLAGLIASAKKAGFPKSSIQAAVDRGQGRSSSGTFLENVIIEAMLPPGVALIIECQTDNKARTLQELRETFKRAGVTMTPTSYMFERKGKIVFDMASGVGEDTLFEHAIDAGALDVDVDEDGSVIVYTEPAQITAVAEALCTTIGLKVGSMDIIWEPKEESKLKIESESQAGQISDFTDRLEDDPSVQAVYLNVID